MFIKSVPIILSPKRFRAAAGGFSCIFAISYVILCKHFYNALMNAPLPCGAVAPMEVVSKSKSTGSRFGSWGTYVFQTGWQMGHFGCFYLPGWFTHPLSLGKWDLGNTYIRIFSTLTGRVRMTRIYSGYPVLWIQFPESTAFRNSQKTEILDVFPNIRERFSEDIGSSITIRIDQETIMATV